jgi:energy-coupling factor transporter ATP-binding protein EcfA2
MNIIDIENLTFSYPAAKEPVIKNLTLKIEKGDFLAIVGNNGCGKSTFCKTLNGLIPHFIDGDFEGSIKIDGADTLESDVGTLARKVGYVYQDFENQIVRPTVLDDASYACLNYAMPDYIERGRQALSLCGLKGREDDYIWQLSGGQCHLLALAGAVSLQPDILILDEPIAQLDPAHADKIYDVLKDLNENHGKTIIVIEHHTEYIADYCKHVMLMRNGNIAWKLPAAEALRRVDELRECGIFPPQVTLAAYRMKKNGILNNKQLLPTTVEEGRDVFQPFAYTNDENTPENSSKTGEPVIQLRDVSISYRSVKGDERPVFDKLNLEIRRGEKIALIGSNGAGKSTLMKLMVGLLKPSSGDIIINGESTRKKKTEQLSRSISLVYQNPEDMFIKDSIYADISYAMQVRNIENWQEHTDELLNRFRLTQLKDRDGRLLSGGQMRRASLAIGVALNPGILLLDEPTANLDISTRKEIMRTLTDMKDITETVMIATHDMQLVCEWAQRIVVLCNGHVIADGTRDEIFGNKEVVETSGIRPPEIFTMGRTLDSHAFCYTIDEFLKSFREVKNNGI